MAIVFPDGTQEFPGRLIKATNIYDTATRVSTTTYNSTRVDALDFWYNINLAHTGSFTKIGSSTESFITMLGHVNTWVDGNSHGFLAWIGTSTSATEYVHMGEEAYTLGNPRQSAACQRLNCSFTALGAGTHTFRCAAGRGDTSGTRGARQFNPESDKSATDCPNMSTRSTIIALELAL